MKTKFSTMKTNFLTYLAILTFFAFGAALLFAPPAMASPNMLVYTATDAGADYETGLAADALSGGVTSDTINMGQKWWGSTLSWQVVVSAGSTADVQVTCEESVDGSVWVDLMGCTSAATSSCLVQKLNYSMADTRAFSMLIERVRAPYMRCSFEDLAAGDSTVTASAVRGSP